MKSSKSSCQPVNSSTPFTTAQVRHAALATLIQSFCSTSASISAIVAMGRGLSRNQKAEPLLSCAEMINDRLAV